MHPQTRIVDESALAVKIPAARGPVWLQGFQGFLCDLFSLCASLDGDAATLSAVFFIAVSISVFHSSDRAE